jgi:hypothetical protein
MLKNEVSPFNGFEPDLGRKQWRAAMRVLFAPRIQFILALLFRLVSDSLGAPTAILGVPVVWLWAKAVLEMLSADEQQAKKGNSSAKV